MKLRGMIIVALCVLALSACKSEGEKLRDVLHKTVQNYKLPSATPIGNIVDAGTDGDGIYINLKLKDENRKMLANSNNRHIRTLVAKEAPGSSEFLNEMLRKELEGEKIEWIVDTIIANKNFVMEEETREMLAKSKEYQLWKKVLRDKGCSSQFLNQMCRKAILEKDYYFSINEIIEHENFQLEDKTLEMLHKNWYAKTRKKLARDERTSYETLEKMYAKETEEEVLTIIELHLLRRLAKQYPLSQTIK